VILSCCVRLTSGISLPQAGRLFDGKSISNEYGAGVTGSINDEAPLSLRGSLASERADRLRLVNSIYHKPSQDASKNHNARTMSELLLSGGEDARI